MRVMAHPTAERLTAATPASDDLPRPSYRAVAVLSVDLGWSMADIFKYAIAGRWRHPHADNPASPPAVNRQPGRCQHLLHPDDRVTEPPERLGGLKRLCARTRLTVFLDTVDAALGQLHAVLPHVHPPPNTNAARSRVGELAPMDESSADAVCVALYTLHLEIIGWLQAADVYAWRAYELGRQLADTCRDTSSNPAEMRRSFGPRTIEIHKKLAELSSALPPHACAVVAGSLDLWKQEVRDIAVGEQGDQRLRKLCGHLPDQGFLWRGILTGRLDPEALLTSEHYISIATKLALNTRQLLARMARRLLLPVLLPLLAIATAVMFVMAIAETGSPAVRAATALVAVGGAVFAGWRAVSGAVLSGLAQLNRPLLAAEKTRLMAEAATQLNRVPAGVTRRWFRNRLPGR